jgi:hypothetical protein
MSDGAGTTLFNVNAGRARPKRQHARKAHPRPMRRTSNARKDCVTTGLDVADGLAPPAISGCPYG